MSFKRIECPICGKKVSFSWYYLSSPFMTHTCSNCNTRIKWHPTIFFNNLIFAIIMIGGYRLLESVFEPPYIGGIVSIIVGLIAYYLLPRKVKIISKGREEKKE